MAWNVDEANIKWMTIEYMIINPTEIHVETMISKIVKGSASDFQIRTHAELEIFTLERTAASIGCTKPSNQHETKLMTVCVVVKPYRRNGCITIQTNLSSEMIIVEMFES